MIQTTKTVSKIKVSPEEMSLYKNQQIGLVIQIEIDQVNKSVALLLKWLKNIVVASDASWIYMENRNVYYIPQIVGVMPNLNYFSTSYQNCAESTVVIDSELMKFSGFDGVLSTLQETQACFATNRNFISGNKIVVSNTACDGMTYKFDGGYGCFNVYRGRISQIYGQGSSSDHGWNIPIFRFNGENSKLVSDSQTLMYWLKYDLMPSDAYKLNTENVIEAYNFLRSRLDYLIADDKTITLDFQNLLNAIQSNTKINWIPKGVQDILSNSTIKVGEKFCEELKEKLLHCDERAIALDPYDEKLLSDPNRGHWDLWDRVDLNGKSSLFIDLGESLTARNPVADVSDGIVAIDFGTKSTVVVYETDELQVLPLQIGSGTYSKGLQAKNYENPTVLQFINLDSFLKDYSAKTGRPDTSWDDLTVSHNAFQNLKDATSEQHNTFFEGLKQWCGSSNQRLKLQDSQGKIWELPPFMDLGENDMNPLEIYAYYLGRYINHMIRGKIFLHYVMSFPVTYEHRIRERMWHSIRKGLQKSLPTSLLSDEKMMKRFMVREVASEPAAYAITALQEYNFEPEDDDQVYYAVFDFGGGTTDFDFGMFKESEDDRYDYTLIHFGENGDRTLSGENLLRLLAFEVFRANKDYLLHPDGDNAQVTGSHIPFAIAPDAQLFAGHESLLKNSREAQQNMRNLMEKLRPVWESPESEDVKNIISSGQIQLTLYRENGNKKTDANLKLKIGDNIVDLQAILRNRIEKGIRRFFTSLAEAFDKSAGKDNRIAALSNVKEISIFLAGNSSRSSIVSHLFEEYTVSENVTYSSVDTSELLDEDEISIIGSDSETIAPIKKSSKNKARSILKFGDDQSMPNFVIYPPLGTKDADAIRKIRLGDIEDSREIMMRPTGKTGVAYGLLKCRDGGEIKVETITPDGERVPFQYYIGRRKKGKFKLLIDRNAKLKTWYKFIDAGGSFDILYTDRPEAATGNAPMTIAKQKHIFIEHPDADSFVYIRPIESRAIEYMIVHDENELIANGDQKIEPIRIELD